MSPGCNPDKEPLPLDEQELEEDLIATDEEDQWVAGSHGEELYEHYRVRVDPGQTPLRIDRFLVDRMPHTSRPVSYTHLTLPTKLEWCRSRWSPYH